MKLVKEIIWKITILESLETCDYSVDIEGTTCIISLLLNSFDYIKEYKTLALQALQSFNCRFLKVV